MAQAFLLFNNDIGLLQKQVELLSNGKNRIVIHIDSKYALDVADPRYIQIANTPCVSFIENRINVQWGSYKFIEVILEFFKVIYSFEDISYVHLLSTQCFPVKSIEEIDRFFSFAQKKQFINNIEFTAPYLRKRFELYHFHELYNPRSKKFKDRMIKSVAAFLRIIQNGFRNINIKRPFPKNFPKTVFGGSAWWSISIDCAKYILDYANQNPDVLKRFSFTQLPDECFIQTIVMNSKFANDVENNNLRYIKFFPVGSSFAAELGEEDIDHIKSSNAFFARKFSLQSLSLLKNHFTDVVL